MGKVIQFPVPQIQTATGEAVCVGCQHEWVAVAEIGSTNFECPNCHAHKGIFKYDYAPETCWECNCGNQLFYITEEGHFCPNCGSHFNPE